MVADNSDIISHYDAERALRIAGGIPAIRDRIVNGILDLFADGGELSALFDVSLYRSNPTQSRALAHRAVGLAKQGAMSALESLCGKLATALKADEFVTAEEFGGNLPTTIELVRAAVAAESSVQSGT